MKKEMKIGCILLAAGQAERFGRNKLLEPLNGKPMIAYVLTELARVQKWRSVKLDILVVTIWEEICRICNQYDIPYIRYDGGLQSDSIRTGLSESDTKRWNGCMFLTGDQPLLQAESIIRLLNEFDTDPTKIYRLCCGEKKGNPIIFPAEYIDDLQSLTGDEGGRQLIRQKRLSACCVYIARAEELMDADTVDDFNLIREMVG